MVQDEFMTALGGWDGYRVTEVEGREDDTGARPEVWIELDLPTDKFRQ